MRLLALLSLVCAVVAIPIEAAAAKVPDCGTIASSMGREHSLACRAFSADGREIEWDKLVGELAAVSLILLGEVHDNADHHRVRAQIVLALSSRWGSPSRAALVFEHISTDQELALTGFRALDFNRRREPSELFRAIDWDKAGWPNAALFRPLFAAALDLEWPILPGNAPKQAVRAVARGGLSTLPADEVERLRLAEPLPDAEQSALLDELEASHCGLMPRSAFGGMADAQRYRDAQMARALVDAVANHGRAVLMAGNGHVDRGRGVPWHLGRIVQDKTLRIVLHLEVVDGKESAAAYFEQSPGHRAVPDFVVFTPRAPRPDPCVEMRKRFAR